MYCKKCFKKSMNQKKVNMLSKLEEKRYICPECGYIIKWHEDNQ